MNLEQLQRHAMTAADTVLAWLVSPQFYAQIGVIVLAVAIAYFVANKIRRRSGLFTTHPDDGPLLKVRQWLYACRSLLFPIMAVLALAVAAEVVPPITGGSAWLIKIAQGIGVIAILYAAINRFVTHPVINSMLRWIGIASVAT